MHFFSEVFLKNPICPCKRKVKDQFYETQPPHPTKHNPILVCDSKNFCRNIPSEHKYPGYWLCFRNISPTQLGRLIYVGDIFSVHWSYFSFYTSPPPFSSLACLCWGRVSMGGYFHIVSCLTFHNLPHQGSFETDWIPNSLIYFWQLICTDHQFFFGCRKWTYEIYLFPSPISPISSLVLVFSSSQCNKTGVVRPLCLLLPSICSSGLHPQIECPSTIEALV